MRPSCDDLTTDSSYALALSKTLGRGLARHMGGGAGGAGAEAERGAFATSAFSQHLSNGSPFDGGGNGGGDGGGGGGRDRGWGGSREGGVGGRSPYISDWTRQLGSGIPFGGGGGGGWGGRSGGGCGDGGGGGGRGGGGGGGGSGGSWSDWSQRAAAKELELTRQLEGTFPGGHHSHNNSNYNHMRQVGRYWRYRFKPYQTQVEIDWN